jgi:hypothetical protein
MSVPGNLYTPTIRKTRGGDYLIEQSLLFNDGDSAYLTRTPSVAGNRKTWTYSVWVKYSVDNISGNAIFGSGATAAEDTFAYINGTTTHAIDWIVRDSSTVRGRITTDAVFRDPGAWYHLVFVLDTTNVTAGDRMRLWINGVEVTSFSTDTNPPLNTDSALNSTLTQYIGKSRADGGTNLWNGLMALPILVDGAALDPTSFGEEDDDGYWNPIEFTGATTTDNVSVGGTASAESTFLSFVPANAFDGNTSTRWVSSATPAWLEYDRGSGNGVISTSYSISCGPSGTASTADMPKNWTIEGYNGSSWDTLATVTGEAAWSLGETRLYTFTNTTSYEKYRIDVTLQQGGGNEIEVGELRFYASGTGFGTNGFQLDYADTAFYGKDISGGLTTAEKFDTSGLTYIGDMTAHSALSTAFDGDLFESGTSGAAKPSSPGFVGVDWGSGVTKTVKGVIVYSYSNVGFREGTNPSVTVTLYGSASSPASATDGTSLGSTTFTDGSGTTVAQIFNDDVTSTTGYRYHWVSVNTGADCHVSEVVFLGNASGDVPANSYLGQNFTAADQLSDTPTDSAADGIGNYATFDPNNPIPYSSTATLSNGNREFVSSGGGRLVNIAIPLTGKWKAEFLCTSTGGGIKQGQAGVTSALTSATYSTVGSRYYTSGTGSSGTIAVDGSVQASSLTDWGPGDIITVLVDMDSGTYGTIDYKINDVSIGAGPYNLGAPAGPLHFVGYDGSANQRITLNSGVNGFTYTDTGYKALATQNLPAPTIADPSAYFNTVLYTGNGTSQSITGVGFQPDLVWMKSRDFSYSHTFVDVVRGATKEIYSNLTNAETTTATGLTSLDSDGFSVGADAGWNANADDKVAWCWKAGGTAVSNTDGSITSSVSVNTEAGFSIVGYDGNATVGATVGHGLSVTPKLIIVKNRTVVEDWVVYHSDLTTNNILYLNLTSGLSSTTYRIDTPTSTTFRLNQNDVINASGESHIAYCWAEVEGFSKFGSYTGNGSADGPFIYLGFKPAFVLIKDINSGVDGWAIEDAVRDTYNPVSKLLLANSSSVELTPYNIDFLSNGFKIRTTTAGFNTNTNTMIFAAFAENPFQGDDGVTQGRAR